MIRNSDEKVKLYAIGVGPGDPDLVTIKAVKILNEVAVVFYPVKKKGATSLALKTVVSHCKAAEKVELLFPMTKDYSQLSAVWPLQVEKICQYLQKGYNAAFITEGDPSLYSTWAYIYEGLKGLSGERERSDESDESDESALSGVDLTIEVVPGISSINAAAAATLSSLAQNEERVAIIPATYGLDDLKSVTEKFETVVLMKVGNQISKLSPFLEQNQLLSNIMLITNASSPKEKIYYDWNQIVTVDKNEGLPYFSTMIIRT